MPQPATSIGPPHSTTPQSARALDLFLTQRGNPAIEIEAILAADPGNVFAHCLRMAMIVRDDDRAAQGALAASIAAIRAGTSADDTARRHADAASAWRAADPQRARDRYAAIVADQPRDALALAVAHALDFRLGNRAALRDRVATALPHWDESMQGYAAILAMYAFGLEENGSYRHAESVARRALALAPGLPAAIHAITHVMEMQHRPREGLDFLAAQEAAWVDGNGFAIHLAWHRALFHLQLSDIAAALAVYDAQIVHASPNLAALADASALLWRLELRNIDLDARWQHLADRWVGATLAHARPFFIVHAVMAFAAAGRTALATRALKALPRVPARDIARTLPEYALTLPVCEALVAFAARNYAACLAAFERVRHIADRCGGSHAQCAVLQLTFAEAAARAQQALIAA